ncbi:MAG: DUF3108 domain-containing protein [Deltaproteobacteria bacterium]|nr:DUF3108 domain-containing protein [Deltaproteobacteria bacterium]
MKKIPLILLAVFLAMATVSPAQAGNQKNKRPAIADAFLDEELTYNIGFWIFENVAEGKVSLKKGADGDYIATLSAYTTGVVEWALLKRKDTYTVHLKMSEDGQRFIPKTFEKSVEMRGTVRQSITYFDYENGVVRWKAWGGGKDEREGEGTIPPGVSVYDPITAFYNFRYGVYGPPEEGREYKIHTFPKGDEVPFIELRIAKNGDKGNIEYDPKEAFLVFAKVNKDLFGSQSGNIEVVFTKDMLPTDAVAKDIIFFGDVRGKLVKMGVSMGFENKAAAKTR